MTSQPIPKYHVAPNFSIPPADGGGMLELGSIIDGVASADEPLNEGCVAPIPPAKLFCGHKTGFTATRSRMRAGEDGLWAKLVGIDGVGGELSGAHERSVEEDVYHFRRIDTVYFNPSQEYLDESMGQKKVKDYVVGSGYDPVYMVTGLKTARGPSVRMSKNRKVGGTAEAGFQNPGGLPIELGPKFNSSKGARQGMGFAQKFEQRGTGLAKVVGLFDELNLDIFHLFQLEFRTPSSHGAWKCIDHDSSEALDQEAAFHYLLL